MGGYNENPVAPPAEVTEPLLSLQRLAGEAVDETSLAEGLLDWLFKLAALRSATVYRLGPAGGTLTPVARRGAISAGDPVPDAHCLSAGVQCHRGGPWLLPLFDGARPLGLLQVQPDPATPPGLCETLALAANLYAAHLARLASPERGGEDELRLRTIVDHLAEGVVTVDAEGRIIEANPTAADILGMSPAKVQGLNPRMPSRTIYHRSGEPYRPEDIPVALTLRTGEPQRGRIIGMERDDGMFIWLSVNTAPISDPAGGGARACVASFHDVTERIRMEQALRDSEARFRVLVDNAPEAIVVYDYDAGRWIEVNREAERLFGCSREELLRLGPADMTPARQPDGTDSATAVVRYLDAALAGETPVFEWLHCDAAGRGIETEVRLVRLPGERRLVRGSITDITERRRVERAQQANEARLRALYDDNPSIFLSLDHTGRIVSANRYGAALLGYPSPEALVSTPMDALVAAADWPGFRQHLRAGFDQPEQIHRWESRLNRHDGGGIWVRITARHVEDPERGAELLLVGQDVTEARNLSAELTYRATHDALTGLVNRTEFERRVTLALEEAQAAEVEHAVCYLDLDQFRVINDTCGHVAGDELLRQLAAELRHCVSRRDTLARLGGDEFAVLLEYCGTEDAARVGERLRSTVEGFRFAWEGSTFQLGASVGLVPVTVGRTSLGEIMSLADTACFAAKDEGRNRVHLYHEEDEELARRHGEMQWVARIRSALEDDRLRLYAQPIVPVHAGDDGEHFELLLRLVDEAGDIVPPGAFLPAAEQYNLSTALDQWVVSTALTWLSDNPERAAALGMCSINLSGASLGSRRFLHAITQTLREAASVPAEKICFEITETAAIGNLAEASRFIEAMRELGCRFALDDFGSGLSSFGYLKNLPVDYLKIDGVFVKDIADDPIDLEVVRAINDLGHVMGKRTIAEFVENDAVLAKLRELGVDYAQGYGIGRPKPLA